MYEPNCLKLDASKLEIVSTLMRKNIVRFLFGIKLLYRWLNCNLLIVIIRPLINPQAYYVTVSFAAQSLLCCAVGC